MALFKDNCGQGKDASMWMLMPFVHELFFSNEKFYHEENDIRISACDVHFLIHICRNWHGSDMDNRRYQVWSPIKEVAKLCDWNAAFVCSLAFTSLPNYFLQWYLL